MTSIKNHWSTLRDKKSREEFVATMTRRVIPMQVAALMKARKLTQKQLADASGLTQGVISRAANPDYGNLTFNTAIKIASGFDVAFLGLFVPFSQLDSFFRRMSVESLGNVPTFVQEDRRSSAPDTSVSRLTVLSFNSSELIADDTTPRDVRSHSRGSTRESHLWKSDLKPSMLKVEDTGTRVTSTQSAETAVGEGA